MDQVKDRAVHPPCIQRGLENRERKSQAGDRMHEHYYSDKNRTTVFLALLWSTSAESTEKWMNSRGSQLVDPSPRMLNLRQ
jgi:hypothetical protein